jgi:hypothetical protein
VIRRAARIAGRVGGELVGIHVVSSDGLVGHAEGALIEHRRVLEELGGTFRDVVGDDIAETLVAAARTDRATQLVIGASRRSRWDELRGGSVVNRLLRLARDLDIHVISNQPGDAGGTTQRPTTSGVGARRPFARPGRRVVVAWSLLVVGLPLLIAVMSSFGSEVGLATEVLLSLVLVLTVAALGGVVPGIVGSVVAVLAINYSSSTRSARRSPTWRTWRARGVRGRRLRGRHADGSGAPEVVRGEPRRVRSGGARQVVGGPGDGARPPAGSARDAALAGRGRRRRRPATHRRRDVAGRVERG